MAKLPFTITICDDLHEKEKEFLKKELISQSNKYVKIARAIAHSHFIIWQQEEKLKQYNEEMEKVEEELKEMAASHQNKMEAISQEGTDELDEKE